MELVSGSHSIGQNMYHLEWCPKYRYNMFKREENKNLCEEVLYEVAKRHKIEITELSVMSDHIHVVVCIPPTMSVSQALQLLKGASARELFKRRTYFRCRYPKGHFWSPENSIEVLVTRMQKQCCSMCVINDLNKRV